MRAMILFLALIVLQGLAVQACFRPDTCSEPGECPDPPGAEYVEPTSPERVLQNLVNAYRRREIDEYAKLLRHDFIFRFQARDAGEIGTDFWTRDQDSTGTHALFASPQIASISIELIHGPATESDDLDLPDAMKIRVSPTKLEVLRLPDTTLLVDGDIQDFFFLRGDPEHGENPDYWYIVEWRDLPGGGGVGKPGPPGATLTSWGGLRAGARVVS